VNFWEYTIKEKERIFEELESSETGLTEKEVENRQRIYGLNEVKVKEVSAFDIFFRQLKSAFFYLLFIAGVIALFFGEKINGILIFIFAFINVFLGFFQEFRAQRAIKLLKEYLPKEVEVLRKGEEKFIDEKFLVPGDIILLDTGDITPADLRIFETKNFLIDESILTGESQPIAKISEPLEKEVKEIFEAKNIAFSGTSVISGKAKGIVIATGKNTQFGKIAKLTAEVIRPSIYEKELADFSKIILKTVLFTILAVFLASFLIKKEVSKIDFAIFCLALIVGIVPEALPVVVGSAISRGASRLAKRKVVVKRLSSIEDLGNMEILCTDKTGTLTENKLTIDEIYSEDKEKCLAFSFLASSYLEKKEKLVKNPFDIAIFQKTKKEERLILKKYKLLSEIPFDPNRKMNSVLIEDENKNKILILRGAPEIILERSSEIEENFKREEIIKEIEKNGEEGKRILAIAYKFFDPVRNRISNGVDKEEYSEEDERDLKFLGYITFLDPLRKTAKATCDLAKKLGVQIKILTGDSKEVAGKLAKDVGLIDDPKKVILGKDLDSLPENEFEKKSEEFNVFARISPEAKLKIIKALQKKYEVGFIGEGINDAPALKIANVAIAVKGAADVSKEAADILLLENDLRETIDGIREGRNIFANINKYIKATLSSNFGNFYSVATMSLILPFLPMLPPQILLVNLLSDFPLISLAGDSVDIEELRKPKMYRLNQIFPLIIFLAIISSIFDFIFLGIFYGKGENLIQTLWFLMSIFTEISLIFSVRTRKFFLMAKKPRGILISLSIFAFLLTLILPFTNFGKNFFQFTSPPFYALLTIFSLILAYLFANEIVKQIYYGHLRRRPGY
jgi:Mg2+-importing ATPase